MRSSTEKCPVDCQGHLRTCIYSKNRDVLKIAKTSLIETAIFYGDFRKKVTFSAIYGYTKSSRNCVVFSEVAIKSGLKC